MDAAAIGLPEKQELLLLRTEAERQWQMHEQAVCSQLQLGQVTQGQQHQLSGQQQRMQWMTQQMWHMHQQMQSLWALGRLAEAAEFVASLRSKLQNLCGGMICLQSKQMAELRAQVQQQQRTAVGVEQQTAELRAQLEQQPSWSNNQQKCNS